MVCSQLRIGSQASDGGVHTIVWEAAVAAGGTMDLATHQWQSKTPPLVVASRELEVAEVERVLSLDPPQLTEVLNSALGQAAGAPDTRTEEASLQVLTFLLDHGAVVNSACGPLGRTALHQAAASLKGQSLELLARRGGDGSVKEVDGMTPLHLAVRADDGEEGKSIRCVQTLLDSGALIDAADSTGYTALHWALYGHKSRTSNLLVDMGADTMVASSTGWTPLTVCLYWALLLSKDRQVQAQCASLQQIAKKILTQPGFRPDNIDQENDEGGTALGYATAYGLAEIVTLLLKKGASMYKPHVDGEKAVMFEFSELEVENFLDGCISYESQGKKISDCVLQFDFTFLKRRAKKLVTLESSCETPQVEEGDTTKGVQRFEETKSTNDLSSNCLDKQPKNPSVHQPLPPPPPPPPPPHSQPPRRHSLPSNKIDDVSVTVSKNIQASSDNENPTYTETVVLEDIAEQHRNLLKHPLPRAFLMLKWRKINNVYKTWIVIKTFYLCLLLGFIIRNFNPTVHRSRQGKTTDPGLPLDATNVLLLVPITILLVVFILVELVQVLVSVNSWVMEVKSWLQLAILSMSAYLVLHFWHLLTGQEELARQVLAFLLPLSYYEFLHELGCHPRFSKYILLFKKISVKFLKYTSIYIGLVIMCAFSFLVMIPPTDRDEMPETIGRQILDTILMFIGEVGVPTMSENFYYSQAVFFLCFVFFVVIVLMNLLNALAVADAKEMLEDADMEMLHSLLRTVAFWENLVAGDPHARLPCSLLPLARMSAWCRLHSSLAAISSPRLHLLPHHPTTWGEEFPCDIIWLLQELLGWNGRVVRVQGTPSDWVEVHVVREALTRVNRQEKGESRVEVEEVVSAVNKKIEDTYSDMDNKIYNLVLTALEVKGL